MSGFRRRSVLKMGAAGAAVIATPALSPAMELELGGNDFHQIRTFKPREKGSYLCTMCPYFDGGFTFSELDQVKKCEGDPNHIATRGKFCSKGLASLFSVTDPDRILMPLKRVGARGAGKWKEISWNEAIEEVAKKVSASLDNPDTIHLNEGGFKENGTQRFMDTLGSQSVVRSRYPSIGNASKQIALKKMMGVDFLFPDLENTRYVLNFGCNIMETALPLAQRLSDGMVNNKLTLITFDVRMSNTAGRSDEWFPIFPGSDGLIALAMANTIMQEGLADETFIDTWTNFNSKELASALKEFTLQRAEKASGIPAKSIKKIAIDFAQVKPATVFSMNGISLHKNGINAEAACQLLAVITGNIDVRGGSCLPRKFDLFPPQPAPDSAKVDGKIVLNHTFPFEVKEGSRKVSILFNHMSNPAYSSPASSLWREVLKDEKLIPFSVDFSPFMSESAELADLILPDVVGVERHEVGSAPTSAWPWVTMSKPTHKPRGKARDVREVLKKIIETVDTDGSRGMKQFWAFSNSKDWVKREILATPSLKKKYKKIKKGTWPKYGKIDTLTRKISQKSGDPVKAKFGSFKADGFPTPSGKIEVPVLAWSDNQGHANLAEDQFVLTTFKVAYHTLSMTTNLKLLAELSHSNPLWLNKEVALKMGIKDSGLVRITSDVGYMVTKAWITQGIHPQVVGLATHVGRTAYGRVAKAERDYRPEWASEEQIDEDIDYNLWWKDKGTNPNDIIPVALDPESGAQIWNDTVVRVSPAEPGDQYGDIHVDNDKHLAIYKKMLGGA
ncbi:MAG: molybdopterin-dependent oxidoreductase [Magnetococcales bacterium]|nr:molybdopterin-dependent oxidoreductase [Magnetococcales bacterium]